VFLKSQKSVPDVNALKAQGSLLHLEAEGHKRVIKKKKTFGSRQRKKKKGKKREVVERKPPLG